MLFIGPGDGEHTDAHEGYVAGLYRNGAFSDIWTDVTRCAEGTFTGYAPACECGWRGSTFPATDPGLQASRRTWVHHHFAQLPPVAPILATLGRPLVPNADFL